MTKKKWNKILRLRRQRNALKEDIYLTKEKIDRINQKLFELVIRRR